MSPSIPQAVIKAAKTAQSNLRVPASVSIAQWADESGWGAHSPGNNPFGIKAIPGLPVQILTTHEWEGPKIGGKLVEVKAKFAVFSSLDNAFDEHAAMLARAPVYRPAFLALPDTSKFLALVATHYATDPLYATKLSAIIAHNGLAKYDVA